MGSICFPLTISALEKDADGYFLIHNAEELVAYNKEAKNNGNGRLAADIDLSSICGITDTDTTYWSGLNGGYDKKACFDGAGHSISNYCSKSALFYDFKRVENLTLKNAYVKTTNWGGGLARECVTLNNCHFEGIVIGSQWTTVLSFDCDTVINCSNYGVCFSDSWVKGIGAKKYIENCYNRGRIFGTSWVAAFENKDVAKNVYNTGKIGGGHFEYGVFYESRKAVSNSYVTTTVATSEDERRSSGLYILDPKMFENGSVTDSLNKYVSANPTDANGNTLLTWVQGEDGYPRFEHVDLTPTVVNMVKFEGDYSGIEVTKGDKISLPKSNDPMFDYDFGTFDGTGLKGDITVKVKYIINTDLTQDEDGFYLIHNADELVTYRSYANKGLPMNARLAADIDLSTVCGKIDGKIVNWEPISAKDLTFDGNGHSISNLYIDAPNKKNQALFINIKSLQNLTVSNAFVRGLDDVAGIAANCNYMTNCHFEGTVIGERNAFALTAYNSYIVNCSNYGICVGKLNATGWNTDYVVNSYNRGLIYSNETSSACKFKYEINATNFYNAGTLRGNNESIFIKGEYHYEGKVSSCYGIKTQSQTNDEGDLIKYLDPISFTNGDVTDLLNAYIESNETVKINNENVFLRNWEQGEDGFPRFQKDTLQPTKGYIVRYVGAIKDLDVSTDGTVVLPTPSRKDFDFVFENGFDGKNITSDTTINVSTKLNSSFNLTQDNDGFYLIKDEADLINFTEVVSFGARNINARLVNDIDMQRYYINSIGYVKTIYDLYDPFLYDPYYNPVRDTVFYEGTFDGAGHSIEKIRTVGSYYIEEYYNGALFGALRNATIKNLVVKKSELDGSDLAGLVGYAENSTIINCGVEFCVIYSSKSGINAPICANAIHCSIENCYNIGSTYGKSNNNYAFAQGDAETSIKNGYSSIMEDEQNDTIRFCNPEIVNISNCTVDTSTSSNIIYDSLVKGESTHTLQSDYYLKKLNQWVDSANAAQSKIVYLHWIKDETDGYPKFDTKELTNTPEEMQSSINALTIYAVDNILYIQSTQNGNATVYDINGRAVKNVIYNEGLTTISGLSSGIYMIQGTKVLIK